MNNKKISDMYMPKYTYQIERWIETANAKN